MKQIKNRVIIDIVKYPDIHEHLIKSEAMNFRTIEQQALYYLWRAVKIDENEKK